MKQIKLILKYIKLTMVGRYIKKININLRMFSHKRARKITTTVKSRATHLVPSVKCLQFIWFQSK